MVVIVAETMAGHSAVNAGWWRGVDRKISTATLVVSQFQSAAINSNRFPSGSRK
jgi:hypothetical protein